VGFEKQQRPILQERYITGEQVTQSRWVDGKIIYRRAAVLVGGNGTSTLTIAALANVLETLVRADVSVNDGTNLEINSGSAVGVLVVEGTGAITATHTGQDYTGDDPVLVLEYTKQ